MFKVMVDKECGCFKRSSLENNLEMTSKDEALMKSIEMKEHMNSEFCGKHGFSIKEEGNTFVIEMGAPVAAEASSGCCGGGCGTH